MNKKRELMMNKILMLVLLSSALPLVAASPAEKTNPAVKAPSVSLSGDLAFETALISNETPKAADIHNVRVGLAKMFLNLSAEGENSEGLKYGAYSRLFLDGNKTKIAAANPKKKPDGSDGDPVSITEESTIVDRAWVELKGRGFGTFQIGQYIGVHDVMIEDASFIMGGNGAMMNGNWSAYAYLPYGAFSNYRQTGDTRAANKITYYTPRFVGLQAGVSYTPRSDAYGLAKYQMNPLTLDTISENAFSGGINYAKSFSGVDVKIAGTGIKATSRDKDGKTDQTQDVLTWEVSARVTTGPIDIAGGYLNNGNSMLPYKISDGTGGKVDNKKETAGEIYDLALKYTIGAVNVAVGGMFTSRTLEDGKVAKLNAYSLTADYKIEKGLVAYVDLTKFDSTNNKSDLEKAKDLKENNGFVGFVGLNVSF